MVDLTGGWRVPERFTIRLVARLRRVPVQAEVCVEVPGGQPHIRALAIAAAPGTGPLSAADLAELDLSDLLNRAIQQEARQHTLSQWQLDESDTPIPLGSFLGWARDQAAADDAAALTAARTATSRDRRRITAADLRRVLDIHAAKGIQGVMDDLGYSERNARRLLARARKELPS
jgi:hypothetical protein